MRKSSLLPLFFAFALALVFAGCRRSSPPPVSQRIAKVWVARTVEENNVVVYNRGVTNPAPVRPGYANFQLNLSNAPTVTYREFDNNTFNGQYSLPNDQTLTLTGLTPQPTGTNGTITFTINSISDTELVLTRTTPSQKTGNTTNKYTLTAQ